MARKTGTQVKVKGGPGARSVAAAKARVPVPVTPEQALVALTLPPATSNSVLYRPELAAVIVDRMANGETLSKICAEPGMPERSTFNGWVLAYEPLRKAWAIARKMKATSLFEEALDLARDLKGERKTVSATEVNALRVAIETLKWSASKLDPGAYGENLTKAPAIAIQINSTLDLGGRNDMGRDDVYTFKVSIPDAPAASATAEPLRAGVHKRSARASGTAQGESDEQEA